MGAQAVKVNLVLDVESFVAAMRAAARAMRVTSISVDALAEQVAAEAYRARLAAERDRALSWLDRLVEDTWAGYGWSYPGPARMPALWDGDQA